ncbi:NIMA-related serine/threonine kinase 1 [Striga asiatica]|uniref:NIMA-related serine/threonine kinase 1 n=1 Tax=Striga asiatica TaxID=4170 RepID=A0A5A7QYZ3_STRAF|nr:NIMA-related serine/threonine kinase 1 [Striga asiatica]
MRAQSRRVKRLHILIFIVDIFSPEGAELGDSNIEPWLHIPIEVYDSSIVDLIHAYARVIRPGGRVPNFHSVRFSFYERLSKQNQPHKKILPVVILLSALLPPPSIQIKEIHTISPCTSLGTKLGFDERPSSPQPRLLSHYQKILHNDKALDPQSRDSLASAITCRVSLIRSFTSFSKRLSTDSSIEFASKSNNARCEGLEIRQRKPKLDFCGLLLVSGSDPTVASKDLISMLKLIYEEMMAGIQKNPRRIPKIEQNEKQKLSSFAK